MKVISWFSGVEGFGLGFERAGMEIVGQCENDKFCNVVLEKRYPEVEKIDDIRKVSFRTGKGWKRYKRFSHTDADVFCGGFPCQDVSVAGKRAGLDGNKSGLWFEFHRVIVESKPAWVVLENVPGLLSSNGGRDFAVIIGGLTGIIPKVPEGGWGNAGFARGAVYSVAWRILDAQYFGVPQRRRRVFIVGYLGGGANPVKVLFEPESGARIAPPRRNAGKDIVGCLTARAGKDGAAANGQVDKLVISFDARNFRKDGEITQTLQAKSTGGQSLNYSPVIVEQNSVVSTPNMISLRSNPAQPLISWHRAQITSPQNAGGVFEEVAPTLNASPGAMVDVRRLTPLECERLQYFPDNWTDVDGMSDTQRYRQTGNAVCVSVAEWIGKQIMSVEKENEEKYELCKLDD